MFSYRHAYHAGNHADVLKHAVLIATLKHLTLKDTALTVVDSHAGAGLYRLDSDYAAASGEAAEGFGRLNASTQDATLLPLAPLLQDYLALVADFNHGSLQRVYPGSPFIIDHLLRPQDRLKLFELHPTDAKTLAANVAQLDAGGRITVLREDGFAALKKFLPPPSRRALVLCDPSYEIKSDYARVTETLADGVKRFATGTFMVWYPIIGRAEAHDLPRKLKNIALRAGRSSLHATLTIKANKTSTDSAGLEQRPGLTASGVFLINPPYPLQAALQQALAQLVQRLGQDRIAAFTLTTA